MINRQSRTCCAVAVPLLDAAIDTSQELWQRMGEADPITFMSDTRWTQQANDLPCSTQQQRWVYRTAAHYSKELERLGVPQIEQTLFHLIFGYAMKTIRLLET
jgi:hypothetical protein